MVKRKVVKKRTVKRKTTKRKPVKKKSKARMVEVYSYQTGTVKSKKVDRTIRARKPGKRISRTGKEYTETRKNRSDKAKYL